MKPGSLVTPRWPPEEIVCNIIHMWGSKIASNIVDLPDYGQIYTVSTVGPHCEACGLIHCIISEVTIFPGSCTENGMELGLPPEYYVEVDPPQENVQSMIDKIIEQTPVQILH